MPQLNSRWFLVAPLVAALILASEPRARGQSRGAVVEPAVPEKTGKELRAWKITGTPPIVDGMLDDEVWTLAETIGDMVQNEPDNMAPPRDDTTLQVAYTDRMLYIAVRCRTSEAARLTTGLGRRDNLPPSDLIRLSFDPRHDHQNAYVFETNPSGMQSDYLFYDDTRQSPDYDAVWDVRTRIEPDNWTAEYAIPFSQLRFTVTPGQPTIWGFNLRRDVYRTGEFDRWVPTPRGAAGFVSRFGHLVFEASISAPRRAELVPFSLGRREMRSAAAADHGAAAGLDARIGLGTAATLSATVNPDFGQVEQDPSVLNLTVFETFFPEKRPFFLEDSRLFVPNFPQMLLFHSRRIGRNPGRIALPSGDTEIERPDATTILGAAKVTGKINGWSYGAISALTGAEHATVTVAGVDAAGLPAAERAERLVEPQTGYIVGRLLRDFRSGSSNVGAMVTAVNRAGDLDATTGGVDFTLRWDQNRGVWTGIAAGTHAPISGRLRTGGSVLSNFTYSRKHISVNSHYDSISPAFRNSDMGFLASRVDKTNVNGGINIMQPDPRGSFRSYEFFTFGSQSWNSERLVFERNVGAGAEFTFRNFWGGFVQVNHDFARMDDLDARGGPPIVKPAGMSTTLFLRSDSRNTLQGTLNVQIRSDANRGSALDVTPTLKMRPTSRTQASISGEYQAGRDVAQWIVNTDATGDGVDDNVYGRLRRHVISLTGRGTYAFSRDMTVEAYLQPFVAVGHYTDVRRLARARSFDFDPVSLTDDPDFNTKSLRSNVVFRWEYHKGSTFYLVWNMSRLDDARPGTFSAGRDLRDAFSGPGTHVLIAKFSYWLAL
jgi:hypothetical protein